MAEIVRTADEIQKVADNVPREGTAYAGMTYEEGVRAALDWVLGDMSDEEFEYSLYDSRVDLTA